MAAIELPTLTSVSHSNKSPFVHCIHSIGSVLLGSPNARPSQLFPHDKAILGWLLRTGPREKKSRTPQLGSDEPLLCDE